MVSSILVSILENKRIEVIEDEYSKYDSEETADQFVIDSWATIIYSRLELTDSSGRIRTMIEKYS